MFKASHAVFFLLTVAFIFFYKTLIFGHIPFPGDLLVGGYEPYRSYPIDGFSAGGVPHKAQGPDVIKSLIPWKYFVVESLKRFEIPFWNPYNFSGNPFMANFQSGVFYPLNFIFLVFDFLSAWTVFIFLIPFLSSYFMYLFLKELRLSTVSSIFSGIVFAFSSYTVVWLQYGNIGHTFLWLPLALLITEKIAKKTQVLYILYLILVLWLSFLAGYIQGYFYLMLMVVVYFVGRSFLLQTLSLEKIFLFFPGVVFPVVLSLFQLLPTLELFQHSTRGNYSLWQIEKLLNPIWYAITVVAPDFFGNPATRNHWFFGTYIERVSYFGAIPLVLALYALFNWKKRKEILVFAAIFFLAFILATDLFLTKFFYLIPMPVLSTAVPTRILALFIFCGSVLSAFGLDFFLEKHNKKSLYTVILSIFAVLFLSWVFTFLGPRIFVKEPWVSYLSVSQKNLILPTAFIALFYIIVFVYLHLKKETLKWVILGGIFIVTAFDLSRFFHKITPFSPKTFFYPQTPIISQLQKLEGIDRFWGYGSGYIESNFQTIDKTFSPEGVDPLHIKAYAEVLAASKDGKIPSVLPRPDANIAPGYGPSDLSQNRYRQKILNMLGVKYIFHKDYEPKTQAFDERSFQMLWQEKPFSIYENKNSAGRFFLTTDYLIAKSKEGFLKAFFSDTFDESKTIILGEDTQIPKGSSLSAWVKLTRYEPNHIKFTTKTDKEALLFLSDNYYPGWKAKVDDKETKIYAANHAFRAIVIPKGQHQVTMIYAPLSFRVGLITSLISGFLLLVFLMVLKRRYVK